MKFLDQRTKKYIVGLIFLSTVFIPRLVGLGHILTTDEPLWMSRGATFINGLSVGNFERTLIAGQPGVTTTWLIGFSTPWRSLAAAQTAIALATSILIVIITYFLILLIGKRWGLITGFFLALDPFLIAHSRIAHTDALLALFYLASIASLLCAFITPRVQRRYIIASAIFGAFALLTKIFAIILIPTALAIIVWKNWKKNHRLRTLVRLSCLWIGVFALSVFIAWPALWFHADKVWNLLFTRATLHTEGTREQQTTSASWYYAREIFFRMSVPVALLLPFGLWQLKNIRKSRHAATVTFFLFAGAIFAFVLNTGSDKSDRYVLFSMLTLVIAAPLGLRYAKRWALLAIAIPIAYLAIDDIRLYPYYLAQYNRLYPIEAQHKLGWGEGLEQAAAWIQTNHPGAKVLSYYGSVFQYFYNGQVDPITHIDDSNADYVVIYRSMFERGADAPETDIVNNYLQSNKTPDHIVTINGLPYVWIFKR